MCGLFGFISDETERLSKQQEARRWKVLMNLLHANAVRGKDSAGFGVVFPDGACRIIKGAMHPVQFARWSKVQEIKHRKPVLVIGHTRLATMGAVVPRNAHPFRCGGIIGAHNGIISNAKRLYADIEVDSQAAFRLLEDHGIKALNRLTGTAALTWVDMHDGTLGMYRHNNPLHAVYVPELSSLFWSSDYKTLVTALKAEGMRRGYQVLLEEDKVYRFRKARDVPEGLLVKMQCAPIVTSYNKRKDYKSYAQWRRDWERGWQGPWEEHEELAALYAMSLA